MRTDDDKLTQAPIEVILGGKRYDIRPLVIRDSRPWRRKFTALVRGLVQKTQAATMGGTDDIIDAVLVQSPDAVIDLFFEYARDLPRDEIEAKATDSEIGAAFKEVVSMAFPLARSLTGAMEHLTETPGNSSSSA